MTIHDIADRYRDFADQQAAETSPTFQAWALDVATDPAVLALLAELPVGKQQPNLLFTAARTYGAVPGDAASLHEVLTTRWDAVRGVILSRSTQTNEAARCAAVLLGLQQIEGPIALLEVGAAAGLCLLPDRYSYTFSDGTRLDPIDGPSPVTLPVTVHDGLEAPARMPDIVWRAGLDLNPLDPASPVDLAWLDALVWPEHRDRRRRLSRAARIAAEMHPDLRRGNLLHDLAPLAAEAPAEATLVITHSATLAYLTDAQRREAIAEVVATGARRIGFEARGVDPSLADPGGPVTPRTLFVAALDGRPYALADGHGSHLTALVL